MLAVATLSGCFGLGKRSDATDEIVKGFARTLAAGFVDQSNLVRTSGPGTFARLRALFPSLDYDVYAQYFGPSPPASIDKPLGARDRPYGALAQYALRAWILQPCAQAASGSGPLFNAPDSSILMEGETAPTDPLVAKIFAAARRAWLYPYKADSGEVQTLVSLYKQIASNPDGTLDPAKDADALSSVCVSLITAPQFWLGNQQPSDAVRRVALELARRPPTFQEYSDYINHKKTLQQIVQAIQATDAYAQVIRDWHLNWLAFYPNAARVGSPGGTFPLMPSESYQGNFLGTQSAQLAKFQDTDKLKGSYFYNMPYFYGYAYTEMNSTEDCQQVEQPFDPRTVEIRWEQLNPVNSQWEMIGAWRRKKDPTGAWLPDPQGSADLAWKSVWEEVPGSITLANGSQKATSLADIAFSNSVDVNKSYSPYKYWPNDNPGYVHPVSGLIGTPLETFDRTKRRVRRFAVSGEQNGMSKVQLYFTHQEAYVCNALDRYVTTCAYRPNTRDPAQIARSFYQYAQWTAEDPLVVADTRYLSDTWMHPAVLDQMKCGVPDTASMARLGGAAAYPKPYDDPNEHRAWPFGYSTLSASEALSLSSLVTDTSIEAWYYPFLTPDYKSYIAQVDDTSIEMAAYSVLGRDINEEPYRLVDDLVRNNKPYSLLVTANYTFGSEYYESYLRGQGYWLPSYPPGFTPSFSPDTASQARRIEFNTFPPLSLKQLESVTGSHSADDNTYFKDLLPMGQINHKVHSGILNMPAFLSAYAPGLGQEGLKLRTMSARYFERLLCMSPAEVKLNDDQKAMQTQFIPLTEGAAKDHLDPAKGCYQCHVNLDPLAAALGSNYMNDIYAFSMGELRIMNDLPMYGGDLYGIRGGGPPATGAFMGEVMHGVLDVGKKLASSTEFYRCVTKKAFINLYGREPQLADAKAFGKVVANFQQQQSYNQMILDLVSMPTFAEGN